MATHRSSTSKTTSSARNANSCRGGNPDTRRTTRAERTRDNCAGTRTIASNAPTDNTGAGDSGRAGPDLASTRATDRAASATSPRAGSKRAWNHRTAERFAATPAGLTPAFARATTNAATCIGSAGNAATPW